MPILPARHFRIQRLPKFSLPSLLPREKRERGREGKIEEIMRMRRQMGKVR